MNISKKNKIIITSVTSVILISLILFLCVINKKERYTLSKLERKGMISFTVNGVSVSEMPSKNDGLIATSIICNNNSNLIWDNDNWEIIIEKIDKEDLCIVNFETMLSSIVPVEEKYIENEDYQVQEVVNETITYGDSDDELDKINIYNVEESGEYKFEVYGAEGGKSNDNASGGKGGYSKGTLYIDKNTTPKLYIVVGKIGNNGTSTSGGTGGYNGGGNGGKYGGGGGGATHIATVSGLLSSLESNKSSILVVAGGGGGASGYSSKSTSYGNKSGGGGGGNSGSNGSSYSNTNAAKGGSQTSGGSGGTGANVNGAAGSFGTGGNAATGDYGYSGGGGSGYYGGGGGGASTSSSNSNIRKNSSGGGGSGFISSSLTEASTATSSHTGNGLVTITYPTLVMKTYTREVERTRMISSEVVNNNGNLVSLVVKGGRLDSTVKTTVPGGTIKFYAVENSISSINDECNAIIEDGVLVFENVNGLNNSCVVNMRTATLEEQVLADNPTILERSSFNSTLTTTNTGTLYSTQLTEDNSTVYYFAGNAQNNWVVFGDYCWRIMRTNTNMEGKGIRMLYAGAYNNTNNTCGDNVTNAYIATSAFNTSTNDTMYVGYKYGTSGSLANNRTNNTDSTIKIALDNWYKTSSIKPIERLINKNAIYCNDRASKGSYSSRSMTFASAARIDNSDNPSLKCGANTSGELYESPQAQEDQFTASSTIGNGKLTGAPFALMTADEVVFAGGKCGSSLSSPYAWYYSNANGNSITGSTYWWTMSPDDMYDSSAYVFSVSASSSKGGELYTEDKSNARSRAVRPVVSLISDALWVAGNGAYDNPYKVN